MASRRRARHGCRRWSVVTAVLALVVAFVSGMPGSAGASGSAVKASGPPPNTFVPTSPMSVARAGQTATLLPDGKVLVAGGGTASAELFNPATASFTPTASMSVARTDATATLLSDGDVLVAGGCCGDQNQGLTSAELYDPSTGAWSPTGSLIVGRYGDTATLLPNGEVLVTGGACDPLADNCDSGSFLENLRSAELYDPSTGTWQLTASMKFGREFHTATLLRDGKVLVTGGFGSCDDTFCQDVRASELYDPTTGKWTRTGSMSVPREQQVAAPLPDGDVLVAGGRRVRGCCAIQSLLSAEVYNPSSGHWSNTGSLPGVHIRAAAAVLQNGWVIVAGGTTNAAAVYEPHLGAWVPVGSLGTVRTDATATLLSDGEVLVAGGDDAANRAQNTAEVYTAGSGPLVVVSPLKHTFPSQRVGTTNGSRTFTVTNDGSAALHVTGVKISGPDAGDFTAKTTCNAGPVPPAGTCTVTATFAPTQSGLRTARVGVVDDAPLSPQAIDVAGYGIGPNVWAPTDSVSKPVDLATETVLPHGLVLVAGGEDGFDNALSTAELYHVSTRTFTPTGSLNVARVWATAIRLDDGEVLVAGGYDSNHMPLSSAELYDPATGKWTEISPMEQIGYDLTSMILGNGKVLVTGFGLGGNYSELYDPTTETWSETSAMPSTAPGGASVMLQDGSVLTLEGRTGAEIYDPSTNTWKTTGSLHVSRWDATATLLPDGEVLVAGGEVPEVGNAIASAELYDPATGRWSMTASMTVARHGQTANLLPDGDVLVAGGCTGTCGNNPSEASSEIYAAGHWKTTGSMTAGRAFQSSTLLPGGDVLVVGGDGTFYGPSLASAEIYTPALVAASPRKGPVGTHVTVTGSGFYAHEGITIRWNASQVLASAVTTSGGSFSVHAVVPSAKPGTDVITATGGESGATAKTTFRVT